MSTVWKERLIKYGLAIVFLVAVLYYHVSSCGGLAKLTPAERYLVLCDGLSIPAMIEIMIGCLFALLKSGILDGLFYAFSSVSGRIRSKKEPKKPETYAEYVKRKRENRTQGYGFLFITGAAAIGVALIFMYLYYQAI